MSRGPIRILHVLPSIRSGGMERALLRLLAHMGASENYEHAVCCLQPGDDRLLDAFRVVADVHVAPCNGLWSTSNVLREIIRKTDADIVHARSTGIWADAALAVRRTSARLILSFHGREHLNPMTLRRRWMNQAALYSADAAMAVSNEAADALSHDYEVPNLRYSVIPNAVDAQTFHPAQCEADFRELRQQLSLPVGVHLVACVANLVPIKSIDVLIRAWRQSAFVHPRAHLVIAGEGPERGDLEALIKACRCESRVTLLGEVHDTARLLRASDLFVLPSQYECCSNAILEAMATGLPVIATQAGGNPELVLAHRTGWLVPPNDPAHLADAIATALLDNVARRRLGDAGRERVWREFNIELWRQRYMDLYERVIDQHPDGTRREQAEEALACAE